MFLTAISGMKIETCLSMEALTVRSRMIVGAGSQSKHTMHIFSTAA
jgi:hypothetical protein